VDVCASDWDATLERRGDEQAALRLGLRLVKGLSEAAAVRIAEARTTQAFTSVQDIAKRAKLDRRNLNALAAAGAFASLTGNRHQAMWAVSGVDEGTPLLPDMQIVEATPLLRKPREGEDIVADYRSLGLTIRRHPLALLRERLCREHVLSAQELRTAPEGIAVRTAGLVITRQRPGSGNTIFVTLEDETGSINVIVWQSIAERQRAALLRSRLMQVTGTLQRQGKVMHVIATQLLDRSRWLGMLAAKSRDFH
jgi:error-prone DNA polymerase